VDGYISIKGPGGEIRIEGSPSELLAVQDLIRSLNEGPMSILPAEGDAQVRLQMDSVLEALDKVGALLSFESAWRWFHKISSNPPVDLLMIDPEAAYALPRLHVAGVPYSGNLGFAEEMPLDRLARERQSAKLDEAIVSPSASFRSAVRLAFASYRLQPDGRRAVASGGALYPLHFWIVGSNQIAAQREILSIDHDAEAMVNCGNIELDELQSVFVYDPGVMVALERGAAVIIIAADPSRVTMKYGNRGWRFALMECGAVMHHILLSAAARKEGIRPIGGYFDRRMERTICHPALPLIAILVMANQ
jgi:nitroreductase